jgi:hypothetical protein
VLALHTLVMTFKLLPALIAPEVTVFTVTVAHLLIAFIAIMFGRVLVSAVDDSVTEVAIVVPVIIYVNTNEFSFTLVTISVIIIVDAVERNPYLAPIASVVIVIVLVIGRVRIFLTLSFLAANIANYVFVIIDMSNTLQFVATDYADANAIFILFNANVC